MIWLTDEDRRLLAEMEAEISKELMRENWEHFIKHTPIHAGSENERQATLFLKGKLEEYGLETEVLSFEAYISDPKYAKLEIMEPSGQQIQCTACVTCPKVSEIWVDDELLYKDGKFVIEF